MGSPRTPAQNRALWGGVQQLAAATGGGREDAEIALRAICQEVAGHEHTSRLTASEADAVLARLRKRVQEARRRRPEPEPVNPAPTSMAGGREDRPITARQQEVIEALYAQVGWLERPRQMAFSRRQCKVPWPQTMVHADQIIEPLKAIALRHTDPTDAWRRAEALVGHPALDAWQQQFIPDLVRQFRASAHPKAVLSPHKLLKLIEAECAVRRAAAA